jgi:CDP-diacylglycerol--serine O-phosphatidyltransferase
MRRVGVLPALVTLANGFCGIVAVYKVHDKAYYTAALLILLAMVFDLLDGLVARRAGLTSRFGAQLDSLSDAISFGVAPGFLAKAVVEGAAPGLYPVKLLTVLTALVPLGALLRLARYNVEHGSDEHPAGEGKGVRVFAGMPTPGAAGIVASLVFLACDPDRRLDYRYVLWGLPVLCALLGYLMVSRVPYVHFGSRFLKGRREFGYFIRVVVVGVLLIMFPHEILALGFAVYGVSGLYFLLRRRGEAEPGAPGEPLGEEETRRSVPAPPDAEWRDEGGP